jgi:hypothetical protein
MVDEGKIKRPHLHDVIIKEKPVAVALDYGDVVTTVWTTGGGGDS